MPKADEVAENAQLAFWAEVARSYPEIKTGDFPPDATFEFNEACRLAVKRWLIWNKKGGAHGRKTTGSGSS